MNEIGNSHHANIVLKMRSFLNHFYYNLCSYQWQEIYINKYILFFASQSVTEKLIQTTVVEN